MDGVVVATLAPSRAQRVEQLGIGEGTEEILDGLQGGTVFEGVLIEERLGRMKDHHEREPGGSEAK